MSLVLKVVSFKNQPPAEPVQISINRYGGTIGRSDSCALCLPDSEKFVSRHHATIKYSKGSYFLTDCSLSGTFINKQKLPLHNQTQQLVDGCMLKIGEYLIAVEITEDVSEFTDTASNESVTALYDASSADPNSTVFNMPEDEFSDSDITFYEHSGHVGKNSYLNDFLAGAELSGLDIQITDPAQTMQKVGQMFRAMVKGTVAVLRSRAEFKSFFHVSRTILTPANNNPLKAVVSINTTLKQLLQDEIVDDLDSVDAIDKGFSDVIDHQLAMQAGIQAALKHILQSFDPENIEQQYDKGLFLTKQAKCWENYKAEFPHMAKSAIDNFFGDEFAEAYENQMKILVTLRNKK